MSVAYRARQELIGRSVAVRADLEAAAERAMSMSPLADAEDVAWLVTALAPDLPGDAPINPGSLAQALVIWNAACERAMKLMVGFGVEARIGFRSVLVTDSTYADQEVRGCLFELRSDGSGFGVLAVRAPWPAPFQDRYGPRLMITEPELLANLSLAVGVLAAHAVSSGATGTATSTARLVSFHETPIVPVTPEHRTPRGRLSPTATPVVRRTLDVDEVTRRVPGLLVVVRDLLAELLTAFGIANPEAIENDGTIRLEGPPVDAWATTEAWADSFGASVNRADRSERPRTNR